jgi:hypothetical protein
MDEVGPALSMKVRLIMVLRQKPVRIWLWMLMATQIPRCIPKDLTKEKGSPMGGVAYLNRRDSDVS